MRVKDVSRIFVIGVIFMLITPFFAFSGTCKNCDQEKLDCEKTASDDWIKCLDKVEAEAEKLFKKLTEAEQRVYDKAVQLADKALNSTVKQCNKISIISLRDGCIDAAQLVHSAATGTALVALKAAKQAIKAEVTVFELAQIKGCEISYNIDMAACSSAYSSCINSQGDPGMCLKCASNGSVVNDDTEPCDDGDACTKNDQCSGGKCVGQKDVSPVAPCN